MKQDPLKPVEVPCPKCTGKRVEARVIPVNVSTRPGLDSPVKGIVCLNCGYIELYAVKPEVLARASEQKPSFRENKVI